LVFVKSGLTKISNIDQTINLFAYEYNLPLLMPKFAAVSSIIFELGCGFAVIFGLLTRISVLPLIAMTLIIQLLVFQNQEHFYWLFLLTTLAIYGAGKISIDAAANYFCSKNKV
jgi:putative oxidoreductase